MSASITSGTYPFAARHRGQPLKRGLIAVWRALRRLGALRAQQHLYRLASQVQTTDPALAQTMRDSARHLGEG